MDPPFGDVPPRAGIKSPLGHPRLPTELPVSYRQNSGSDLNFSVTPGSDTGADRCPGFSGSAGGPVAVLRAGAGRG